MIKKTADPRPFVLVVHGAEIFDSDEAAWLLATLCPLRTIVAGVMARTAAEESGLPVEFDGSPPSRILNALDGPAVLANHAKTAESGRIFGSIIASRLKARKLVQIECSDRSVIVWNGGDMSLASRIAALTGYRISPLSGTTGSRDDERSIRGCLPGEPVYMNGIIIGQATGDTVVVRKRGAHLEAVSGLVIKEHGFAKLEKAGVSDPAAAWCKSGPIRRVPPGRQSGNAPATGRVIVIDHCGHALYSLVTQDCCGILSIGDDTTSVCGHISAHRGIPVLGIVDGDRDTPLPSAFPKGSVVLLAQGERDDDIGEEVARMAETGPVDWNRWVEGVIGTLGGRVRVVIDTREQE
jgi:hypothetical protein